MSFLDLVQKRSSVRKFSDQPVSREVLTRCLEAARLAPSACNSQPWSFIVVDDPQLRQRIADKAFTGMYSINTHAKTAPVFVVVVTEPSGYMARLGGQFKGVQYNLIDVGIAVDHFTLQAAEEGLGTCWLGWFNSGAVKKILGIPWNKRTDIMLSVGYPADPAPRSKIRKDLTEMSRFNT